MHAGYRLQNTVQLFLQACRYRSGVKTGFQSDLRASKVSWGSISRHAFIIQPRIKLECLPPPLAVDGDYVNLRKYVRGRVVFELCQRRVHPLKFSVAII